MRAGRALRPESRRPYRHANKLPFRIERSILGIKCEHFSWGAPKIRNKLIRLYPMIKPPAVSTVHAVLDRHGLVRRRRRRRHKGRGTELTAAHQPNGLWCADYKGEFMLGDRRYCYPLTITDYRSRYLLACEGLRSTRSDFAFAVFERTFKDYGLQSRRKIDPRSFAYRYPVDRDGKPLPVAKSHLHLPTLADVMDGVSGYFDGCDGYLR